MPLILSLLAFFCSPPPSVHSYSQAGNHPNPCYAFLPQDKETRKHKRLTLHSPSTTMLADARERGHARTLEGEPWLHSALDQAGHKTLYRTISSRA